MRTVPTLVESLRMCLNEPSIQNEAGDLLREIDSSDLATRVLTVPSLITTVLAAPSLMSASWVYATML